MRIVGNGQDFTRLPDTTAAPAAKTIVRRHRVRWESTMKGIAEGTEGTLFELTSLGLSYVLCLLNANMVG